MSEAETGTLGRGERESGAEEHIVVQEDDDFMDEYVEEEWAWIKGEEEEEDPQDESEGVTVA